MSAVHYLLLGALVGDEFRPEPPELLEGEGDTEGVLEGALLCMEGVE